MGELLVRVGRGATAVAALAFVVAAAGCGYAVRSEPPAQPPPGPSAPSPQPAKTEPRAQTVRVYFVKGEQFEPVGRPAASAASAPAAAVRALLAGPTQAERARGIDTAIPAGTTLAALDVEAGTAHVQLNGVATPETSFDVSLRPARAAQVVYTLTALPGVEGVLIDVNGTRRATYVGSTLTTKGALDQHDLSGPVRLARQPAKVPAGPAPVDVQGVQKRLHDLGYLPAEAVSGAWDYRTRHAVVAFQSWHGLTRDGIVGPQTIAALEAAAPPAPTGSGDGARIEVHRAKGVVLLVDGRRVVRAVHASAGAPGYETPAGSYSVFRKELRSWSVPYQVWLPYASYFNAGIAFHAYDDVPAQPASHGCVRLPTPEAPFVYEFAAIGTPVTVY